MQVQQTAKKLPGESGGKTKAKLDFRREAEEGSASLSLLCTMPKLENSVPTQENFVERFHGRRNNEKQDRRSRSRSLSSERMEAEFIQLAKEHEEQANNSNEARVESGV